MVCMVGRDQNQQSAPQNCPSGCLIPSYRLPCLQKLACLFCGRCPVSGLWIRENGRLVFCYGQREGEDTVFLPRAVGQKGKEPLYKVTCVHTQALPEEPEAQSPSALQGLFPLATGSHPHVTAATLRLLRAGTTAGSSLCPQVNRLFIQLRVQAWVWTASQPRPAEETPHTFEFSETSKTICSSLRVQTSNSSVNPHFICLSFLPR